MASRMKIIKASTPWRRRGKWSDLVLKMKNRQSVIVDSCLESKAIRNAAVYYGKSTVRRKLIDGKFQVWLMDKPVSVREI